jgi:hypothetical protein
MASAVELEPAPAMTGRSPDAQLHDSPVLVVRQGRGLAGGADGHEPVHAAADLALHEGDKSRFVDCPVAEGGDEGG